MPPAKPTPSQETSVPFGLWPSPITPGSLAEGKRLDGVCWDSDGRTLVWLEGRSGRGVLVAQTDDDAPRDLNAELNVRAEVGYGGGDFTVHGGYVYFIVRKTGRIFRQPLAGGEVRPHHARVRSGFFARGFARRPMGGLCPS